jgi:Pentapeptide repeats (8 copies)
MWHKAIKRIGYVLAFLAPLILIAIVADTFGTLPKRILQNSVPIRGLSPFQLANAESNIRGSLLQAVGGILLVAGAITAWRQFITARKQQSLDRHVAITEAFAKAIENLGNKDSTDVRLGGIYSLDRVSDDDPAERARVAEILSAFIRDRSSSESDIPQDVLAALRILTRRVWPIRIDLTDAHLKGVQLRNAQLANARLNGVNLSEAHLSGADFRQTDFTGADLRKADLKGVDLRDTSLTGTRMSGAHADSTTRWPNGFVPADHGILIR